MSKKHNPIDYESALDRTGGDREFLKELLDLYIQEFEGSLRELQKAIHTHDFKGIKETGHSLKGSSGNLSLPRLQKTSSEIEISGDTKDISRAKGLIKELEEEFERLKEFIS